MLFHIIQEKIKGVTHFQTWLSENAQKIALEITQQTRNKLHTLVVSVFPVPAGPAGAPPIDICNACANVI